MRCYGHNKLTDCLAVWSDSQGHKRKVFARFRPEIGAIECRMGGFNIRVRRWLCWSRYTITRTVFTNSANWASSWKQTALNEILFRKLPERCATIGAPENDQLSLDLGAKQDSQGRGDAVLARVVA